MVAGRKLWNFQPPNSISSVNSLMSFSLKPHLFHPAYSLLTLAWLLVPLFYPSRFALNSVEQGYSNRGPRAKSGYQKLYINKSYESVEMLLRKNLLNLLFQ